MRGRLTFGGVAVLLTLASTGAEALEDLKANSFLPGCHAYVQGNERQQEAVGCLMYVAGVLDGATAQAQWDSKHEPFSLQDVPYRQYVNVVTKYMDTHPDDHKLLFVTVIFKAMIEAWPCSKLKEGK
jgi:Rap1a immunity proteins